MTRQTLTELAEELLGEHASRTTAEIAAEAVARRVSRAKDPSTSVRRALEWDERFVPVPGERWILHERVVAFPVSHRITSQEADSDTLAAGIDLGTLGALIPDGLATAEGVRLQVLRGETAEMATGVDTGAALRGPQGWPGFVAGTLVQVRAVNRRVLIDEIPDRTATDRMRGRRFVAAAREALEQVAPDGRKVEFTSPEEPLAALIAGDPELEVRALPPWSEVLERTGLETHHGWLGAPGTDWAALDRFVAQMRRTLLAERLRTAEDDPGADQELEDDDGPWSRGEPDDDVPGFDDHTLDDLVDRHALDASEERALGTVLDMFVVWNVVGREGTRPSESTTMRRNLAELVAMPRVALAMADYATMDPRVEAFATDLWAATAGRWQGAGAAWLLGTIAEARGDHPAAERQFRTALTADRAYALADLSLMGLELDRGQYSAALARMRRLGLPDDDPDVVWATSMTGPALPRVGRNDPCPCGSGRKYKACHLDRPADAAPDPAKALHAKVGRFMRRPEVERAMEDLVHEALGLAPGDIDAAEAHDDPWFTDAEARLLEDHPELVVDVLLHERGWLRRFLDLRGALLPEGERALGEAWLGVSIGLYEVVAAQPGRAVELRDVVEGGQPVTVADRSLSGSVEPLDLLLTRLLPDGRGGIAPASGLSVPRPSRAAVAAVVIADDPLAILGWVALPAPASRLRNMDGQLLVFVTVTFRVPDPAAARAGLAEVLEEASPGTFLDSMEARGGTWNRGSIVFDGSTATITANSRPRAEALERTLAAAAPGAELVDRSEEPLDQAVARLGADGAGLEQAEASQRELDALPEVQALLDETTRQFEVAWVDESIPALGGRTPRQAIRTEKGRREVLALLDDMAWMRRRAGDRAAGLMDPDRIRVLLGLAPAAE